MIKYYCDICGKECTGKFRLSITDEESDDWCPDDEEMTLCRECCRKVNEYLYSEIEKNIKEE